MAIPQSFIQELVARADVVEIVGRYDQGLHGVAVQRPSIPGDPAEHVWHLYVIRSQRRDALQAQLQQAGIQTLIHYPIASADQAPYRQSGPDCPLSRQLAGEVLSLPLGPHLQDSEVDQVIDAVRGAAVIA